MTTTATISKSNNPLLQGSGLPPFADIKPEHVVPAIKELIDQLDAELTKLETIVEPTWTGLVEPLEKITERLTWTWGAVSHLMGVKNSSELREAYEAVQPLVVQFSNKLSQSQPIHKAFKALRNSNTWTTLEPAQQRIVNSAIRDAEPRRALFGLGLDLLQRADQLVQYRRVIRAVGSDNRFGAANHGQLIYELIGPRWLHGHL